MTIDYFEDTEFIDLNFLREFPEFFPKVDNDAPTEVNELASAIQFNMNLSCECPDFENVCSAIKKEIAPSLKYNTNATDRALKSVLANMLQATQVYTRQAVFYSRNDTTYKKNIPTNFFDLRRDETADIIDTLAKHNFIENTKGFRFDKPQTQIKARQSRIQAKSKLISSFESCRYCNVHPAFKSDFVILRDDEKNIVTHNRSQRFLGLNKRTAEINTIINSHSISLPNKFIEKFSSGNNRLNINGNFIHLQHTYLYRIYNKTFSCGGRFYRGFWQQLDKEDRKLILIDGQKTTEKDFKAIHPNLLYVQATGAIFSGDPYSIPEHNNDIILRKATKLAFLIILNAKDERSAKSALYQRFNEHDNGKEDHLCRGCKKFCVNGH